MAPRNASELMAGATAPSMVGRMFIASNLRCPPVAPAGGSGIPDLRGLDHALVDFVFGAQHAGDLLGAERLWLDPETAQCVRRLRIDRDVAQRPAEGRNDIARR